MSSRIRKKGFYGLSRKEIKELLLACRLQENFDFVKESAYEANEDLSEYIIESLCKNVSYDQMTCKKYIPISKGDFYAYRRKTIFIFSKHLRGL